MIKDKIRTVIRRLIPNEYLWLMKDRLIAKTFGQLGEDAVIDNHLGWLGLKTKLPGAYLDIGAYHPTNGSNSYRFYRTGSSGIVVDIGARKRRIWKIVRPRDRFIDAAVMPDTWESEYVTFNTADGYGNAMDHVDGFGINNRKGGRQIKARAITAELLSQIVLEDSYWFNASWRFINIDIEGLDDRFLKDLKLEVLVPDVVAVEKFIPDFISDWDKITYLANDCDLVKSMTERGYSLQSVCGPTLIFVRVASLSKPLIKAYSDKD